jgi:predicted permease
MQSLLQDLRYALRTLSKNPGFSIVVVLSMALGVGANAAMFSVVDRVFFQAPTGVVDPAAVRRVYARERIYNGPTSFVSSFSVPDLDGMRESARGLAKIEGYELRSRAPVGDGGDSASIVFASPGFFDLVGVRPQHGRFPFAEENVFGDPRHVAVLSDSYWRRSFGADSGVVGRSLRVDTTTFTIIGVAQAGFEGLDLDVADLWAPLASRPPGSEGNSWWVQSGGRLLRLVARLEVARDSRLLDPALTAQRRRIHRDDQWFDPSSQVVSAPLLTARGPVHPGNQDTRNLSLVVSLAAVALLVLVLAISNVASLLLMRALRRQHEIALRLALGISRRRLITQMLTESFVLAFLAGGLALLIASWAGNLLRAMLLANVRWTPTVIDRRLVVAVVALAFITGLVAGLAPAALALRGDIARILTSGNGSGGRAQSRLRVGLLVTQAALCALLLVGAGVFLQSLRRAVSEDVGFDSERIITVDASGTGASQDDIATATAIISTLPSVQSVAMAAADLSGSSFVSRFQIPGYDTVSSQIQLTYTAVDSSYFRTVGLRVLAGRGLSARDGAGAPPVAVISEAMAKMFWPGVSPVDQCFYSLTTPNLCKKVVGVVRDIRWNLNDPAALMYFIPIAQWSRSYGVALFVRTREPASVVAAASIERALRPVFNMSHRPRIRRVVDRLEPQIKPRRVAAALYSLFGLLALASAAAGIFGLVAYDVTRRTREVGVRLALGARPRELIRMFVTSGLRAVALGAGIGVCIAVLSGRAIAAFLYDTSPYEPTVLVATLGVLLVVAVCASLLPAYRATRVDPVAALQSD